MFYKAVFQQCFSSLDVPEPTTTNTKNPIMMGPTGVFDLFAFCSNAPIVSAQGCNVPIVSGDTSLCVVATAHSWSARTRRITQQQITSAEYDTEHRARHHRAGNRHMSCSDAVTSGQPAWRRKTKASRAAPAWKRGSGPHHPAWRYRCEISRSWRSVRAGTPSA